MGMGGGGGTLGVKPYLGKATETPELRILSGEDRACARPEGGRGAPAAGPDLESLGIGRHVVSCVSR